MLSCLSSTFFSLIFWGSLESLTSSSDIITCSGCLDSSFTISGIVDGVAWISGSFSDSFGDSGSLEICTGFSDSFCSSSFGKNLLSLFGSSEIDLEALEGFPGDPFSSEEDSNALASRETLAFPVEDEYCSTLEPAGEDLTISGDLSEATG